MRSRLLVTTALLVGVVAVPASALPSGGIDGSVTVSYVVPTRDAQIYLEVVKPTSHGKVVRAPVILTYSPYSVLGRNGDAGHWVPKGYARAYADVIGTGNSGGCYDYGGNREKRTGHDVVEWIARQRWTTGKVGMLGGSYDGTTQYATAVTHPRGLATIVPEAAISRWYDYAYAGGMRYTDTDEDLGNEGPGAAGDEGVDTPLGFDFGFAIPPPADPQEPGWQERVASTVRPCDELAHTSEGYNQTPDYDGFWMDRDYVHLLPTVHIPVLVASNWGDWNVKQKNGWDAYHALTHSVCRRLYMGTRWEGHGTPPGAGYSKTVDKWFARWLQGKRNGVERMPAVTSQTSDDTGPIRYLSGPEPRPAHERLYLAGGRDGGWTLSPAPLHGTAAATYVDTSKNTEMFAATHPFADAGYLAFASAPLKHDMRLFGRPVLHLWSTSYGQWVTVTPSLLDLDPAKYAGSGAGTFATDPLGCRRAHPRLARLALPRRSRPRGAVGRRPVDEDGCRAVPHGLHRAEGTSARAARAVRGRRLGLPEAPRVHDRPDRADRLVAWPVLALAARRALTGRRFALNRPVARSVGQGVPFRDLAGWYGRDKPRGTGG